MHASAWIRSVTVVGFLATALVFLTAATPARHEQTDQEWIEAAPNASMLHGDGKQAYREVRMFRMRAARGGLLTIDGGGNGGADVRGWDRDSIVVAARIEARAHTLAEARDIARNIRIDVSGQNIHAEGPSGLLRQPDWYVIFRTQAPRRYDLRLDAKNGPVGVRDLSGRMQIRTVNGPLTLANLGGDVTARVTNGPMTIALSGNRWSGRGLDVEGENGPIQVRLPDDYSAELETGTVNGPSHIAVAGMNRTHIGGRARVTLGSGGPLVRIVTTNGPINVSSGSGRAERGEREREVY